MRFSTSKRIFSWTLSMILVATAVEIAPVSVNSTLEVVEADSEDNLVVGLDISYSGKTNILSWDKVPSAASYRVYRSTGKYSKFILYKTVTEAELQDTVTDSVYRYYYKVSTVDDAGNESALSEAVSLESKIFGDNMKIFSPSDSTDSINEVTSQIASDMAPYYSGEFSEDRYGIFFKPGSYDIDGINVGYYTQVAGLGKTPKDTLVPMVYCEVGQNGSSLINFWRSVENIGIDTGSGTRTVKWAASQAAPIRRVYVNGSLRFDEDGNYASGGYLSDTYVTGKTVSSSQQQFFLRNNVLYKGWTGGLWNIMFVGCKYAPANKTDWASARASAFTTIENTEVVREKPFLYLDDQGEYSVFVPSARKNTNGVSWTDSYMGDGVSLKLDKFYVARPEKDNADTLNAALAEGKNLLFTPGVYSIESPLKVDREDTVLLGLGMATLKCDNAEGSVKVGDVGGVVVAGILFDANSESSEYLLKVGNEKNENDYSDNPILLSDVFTRVGGSHEGKVGCISTVIINSNNVIGDHFWLWRADHGKNVSRDESIIGWNTNMSDNGLVVNGDKVSVYGLFVEHFQQYQTLWNGNDGKTYFYQSELPYDVASQSVYMSHDGTVNGYASYKVDDSVTSHEAYGLGVYECNYNGNEVIVTDNAIEVSAGTHITNAFTIAFRAWGRINSIVNGTGDFVGYMSSDNYNRGYKHGINYYAEDGSTNSLDFNYKPVFETSQPNAEPETTTTTTVKRPGRTRVKTVKTAGKKIKITLKKVAGAKGYQLQWSLKKNMKKAKSVFVKKLTYTIKKSKLKSGRKYYFRARAYKVVNGKKKFGAWSKVVSRYLS